MECSVTMLPKARVEVMGTYWSERWRLKTRLVIWEPEPYRVWSLANRSIGSQPHVCRRPGHYALGWQSEKLALYALKSAYPYVKPYRPALLLTHARGSGRGQGRAFEALMGGRLRGIVKMASRDMEAKRRLTEYHSDRRDVPIVLTEEEWRRILDYFQPSTANVHMLPTTGVYTVLFHPGSHPECRNH